MWTCAAVAVLLLGQVSAPDGARQPPPAWLAEYGYGPRDVSDFRFGDPGVPEVPIVTAAIQGAPLPLIFDTGTNGYAALDAGVIARLGLPVRRWETWLDSSGKPAGRIPTAVARSLGFGPLHLAEVEILGMGPESIMGKRTGYAGTLGWWSFRDYRVTLDYSRRTVALSRSPLPAGLESCATRHVTRFVSPADLAGLVLVEGRVDGKSVYLEVDTGKSSTVIDPKLQAMRHFKEDKSGYLLEGIQVGPFEVRSRFGRMFSGFDGFSRGLDRPVYVGLGSDFLKHYLVTIDYPGHQVVLEEKPCGPSGDEPAGGER